MAWQPIFTLLDAKEILSVYGKDRPSSTGMPIQL